MGITELRVFPTAEVPLALGRLLFSLIIIPFDHTSVHTACLPQLRASWHFGSGHRGRQYVVWPAWTQRGETSLLLSCRASVLEEH